MVIPLHPRPFHRSVVPAREQLQALREHLLGDLVTADHDRYDALRQVQEFTVDRRPLAIVHAADEQDVAAAVRFARERGHPLAVRSGGHSLARLSMIDDAIVVDLSGMKRVVIDPAARTAHVQAAPRPATWPARPTSSAWPSRPATPHGRHGRADHRRRHRVHGPQVRPRHRQPALGARRHRRRRDRDRQRQTSIPTSSGRSAAAAATSASSPSSSTGWRRSVRSWAASCSCRPAGR